MEDQINALKEKGNAALAAGKHDEAIAAYTEALKLNDQNYLIYSNRSAAYVKAGKYQEALQDAQKTVSLNPTWAKGYSRLGTALSFLDRVMEAYEAYNKGLQYDRSNTALLTGLDEMKKRLLSDLASEVPMDVDPPTAKPSKATPKPEPKVEENLPENKRLAKREKEQGNEAYKKRDFETAIAHYEAAIQHDSTDITFYNNLAAVHFEKHDYQKCIAECEKGIAIGRENRADFKLIAKAFSRIGNAYRKLEEWKSAKTYYEKSMSEHRTPEVKTLLSEIERKIKEEERKAYIDPGKAEEEKEKGNEAFKKADYSAAVKHYTEAIKRNPDDPKLYSNRAACYTKLAAFDLGLKDCDTCVKLDDKFIKGWIRKGKILQGMQQQSKALQAYQKALELDPSNAEAIDGYRTCTMAVNSNPEEVLRKAMSDPEVQGILQDPAMRLILDQMQEDPKAVQEHLKNPAIASKIQKLLECGIIKIH